MLRQIFISSFAIFIFSFNCYSQSKTFSTNKYASTLMECYYTMKTVYSVPLSGDAIVLIEQKVFNLAMILQRQLQDNKIVIENKIGNKKFNELETQIKNYLNSEAHLLTPEQKASAILWLSISKPVVEEIFIALNK